MKKVKIGPHFLFRGDCLDIMPKFPESKIDLILCDLPYGTTANKWDTIISFEKLWANYNRLIMHTSPVILFAAQPFASELVTSNRKAFKYDLIWKKNKSSGHLNAKKMPMHQHEHVLVFYEKFKIYNPIMSTGHNAAAAVPTKGLMSSNYGKQKQVSYKGGNTTRYPTSVLDFSVINNDSPERKHPTQKPVDICRWLIETYSKSTARVLDNCMGSGTTGVASIKSGRRFVGIENNKEFFDVACDRINQAYKESK